MEMIISLSKKEENSVLNHMSDLIEKRVCVTEVWEKHCKAGSIQINPTEENLNVLINVNSECFVDTIDMCTDLLKDVAGWAKRYTERLMSYCEKWEEENAEPEE